NQDHVATARLTCGPIPDQQTKAQLTAKREDLTDLAVVRTDVPFALSAVSSTALRAVVPAVGKQV
ncbi:MAG: hypothetical protein ACRDND_25605, partial [Streptosporangiaceae bacterium]